MTHSTKNRSVRFTAKRVDLLPQDALGEISVNPKRFARFDMAVSGAMDELVARWSHKAAPADVVGSFRDDGRRHVD